MSTATAGRWLAGLRRAASRCLREPIIVVLLLSGVFTVISGSYVHGAVLLAVAIALAWEAARRPAGKAVTGRAARVSPGPAAGEAERPPVGRAAEGPAAAPAPATALRRALAASTVIVGGALYAVVVGSFQRYSWPATAAVAGLAAAVVAVGWRGPRQPGRDPGTLPAGGAALWAGLLIAAGLWELAAYFQQGSLTTISYAHPTVSALTDPLLVSHAGRSGALAAWLAAGWFLVRR